MHAAQTEHHSVSPGCIGEVNASAGRFGSPNIEGDGGCEDVYVDIEGSSEEIAVGAPIVELSEAGPRSTG